MIDAINRRTAITKLLGAAAAGLTPVAVKAAWATQSRDGGPTGQELGDINRIGWGFMRPYSVPGMSVAIARNGKFVYSKGFGAADRQKASSWRLRACFESRIFPCRSRPWRHFS
jgi:CubicO group peptidase (beta-lactamase class C family)